MMTIRVPLAAYSLVHHMLGAAWGGGIAPWTVSSYHIELAARSGAAFVGYGPTLAFVEASR